MPYDASEVAAADKAANNPSWGTKEKKVKKARRRKATKTRVQAAKSLVKKNIKSATMVSVLMRRSVLSVL